MDPIIPPEIVAAQMSRSEAHCDDNDRYNARYVCRDSDVIC
jgi:hypothetical protein